jgi:hypothetical protein
MHGLRHKSLSSKQAAPNGGGTQTGCSVDGVRSSKLNTRRTRAQASNPKKSSAAGSQFTSIGDGE